MTFSQIISNKKVVPLTANKEGRIQSTIGKSGDTSKSFKILVCYALLKTNVTYNCAVECAVTNIQGASSSPEQVVVGGCQENREIPHLKLKSDFLNFIREAFPF